MSEPAAADDTESMASSPPPPPAQHKSWADEADDDAAATDETTTKEPSTSSPSLNFDELAIDENKTPPKLLDYGKTPISKRLPPETRRTPRWRRSRT
ncbi:hypothetical protein PIB30_013154 [Stylosanthes scabra]|uniref:Uncharacterized protein n=1 Tax=Stylosanthes scabra TaxID=79078 RepID=A0ABU6Y3G6_9FABA|nr:hypothetical protein [Stylosanthes scabra]